jgi:transcriptional regulator with XRE-family HTH domain
MMSQSHQRQGIAKGLFRQDTYRLMACVYRPQQAVRSDAGMDDRELFGKKLRAIRESKGLSREQLAEKLGISANYIGEIERSEKWPTFEMLGQLAAGLQVSLAAFFDYEAEEIDPAILLAKIHQLLDGREVQQLQQALRVLRALFIA